MYIKSIASILVVTSSFILAIGQTTPEPQKEKTPKVMTWHFDGDGSYLGVQTQEVNKENFSKYGLREVRGIAVLKVVENSPAAAAGILAGDVIVRLNGEEITSTRKLTRLLGEIDPDHQARVSVIRGGSEREITATVARRPAMKFDMGNFNFSFPDMPTMPAMPDLKALEKLRELPKVPNTPQVWTMPGGDGQSWVWRGGEHRVIGVGITPLTKQLAAHFGVDSGAMINEVRENSPASKAGLQAGDIIVEVDGTAVKGQMDLIKAVNSKKEGNLTLTIVRDGKRQTVTVTPETSKDGGFFFETGDDQDG